MGGVVLHDNAIANKEIRLRGRKLSWPLLYKGIDSENVNPWKILKIATITTLSQININSQIVLDVLKTKKPT